MSKRVLLTAAGTGADMWTGYPADLARRMEDLWYFQPIDYGPNGIPAIFPMGPSYLSGVEEGVRLVLQEHADAEAFGLCGYSQGGMVVSALYNEFQTGRLKAFKNRLIAGATFGNPNREKGSYAGTKDPGGRGIADTNLVGTPDWWLDCAESGDIYTNVPDNEVGADMTAIFKLVQLRGLGDLIGPESILVQIEHILTGGPLQEFPAIVQAIIKGLIFAGQKPATAPHIEYHIRQCAGTGTTYYEHAVAHMRARGAVRVAA